MLVWAITVGTVIGTVYGQSRIIGGQDTGVFQHPYQISLQTSSGAHFCGGFLISPMVVVTAAHCVYNQSPSTIKTYRIRAGSTFYNSQGQMVKVQRAIVHPNYSSKTLNSDIALLFLASKVTDKMAKAANLPRQNARIPDGTYLNVTGWGITKNGGDLSEHLKVVRVPTVSQTVCQRKYRQVEQKITDNMFCAGFIKTGGKDSCSGDSGGPAAKGSTVYGIVSWGVNCANPKYPGVYTQLSNFRNWIRANSGV